MDGVCTSYRFAGPVQRCLLGCEREFDHVKHYLRCPCFLAALTLLLRDTDIIHRIWSDGIAFFTLTDQIMTRHEVLSSVILADALHHVHICLKRSCLSPNYHDNRIQFVKGIVHSRLRDVARRSESIGSVVYSHVRLAPQCLSHPVASATRVALFGCLLRPSFVYSDCGSFAAVRLTVQSRC